MNTQHTAAELESMLGENIRNLRLQKNIGQIDLARQAGISRNALINLESGRGSTINTLVQVLRALGRTNWIDALAPTVAVSPLAIARGTHHRQRASTKKASHGEP